MVGEVGVEDVGGSYEFAFVTRGEWLGSDGLAVMVISEHEIFASTGRSD